MMVMALSFVCEVALIWTPIRYAGLFLLLFLIGHMYLIGVWFGEDRRTNTIQTRI